MEWTSTLRTARALDGLSLQAEVGKQSHKTLLDVFERYIQGYMTLFDTV